MIRNVISRGRLVRHTTRHVRCIEKTRHWTYHGNHVADDPDVSGPRPPDKIARTERRLRAPPFCMILPRSGRMISMTRISIRKCNGAWVT